MPGLSMGLGVGISAMRTAFSPASLFRDGSQGVWCDPSDLSTMFQDAAGTTPVTAPGDPVGLLLDKSRGLTLGPELLDEYGSGWTAANTTPSISEDTVALTNGAWRATYSRGFATIVGQSYRLDYGHITDVNGSSPLIRILTSDTWGGTQLVSLSPTASGGSVLFTATTTTTYIYLGANAVASGLVSSFGPTSVKHLPGHHASQATASKRPTYQTDGTLHWLSFDGVDDFMAVPLAATQSLQKFTAVLGLSFRNIAATGMVLASSDAASRYAYAMYSGGGEATARLRSSAATPDVISTPATNNVPLITNTAYDGSVGELRLRSNGTDAASTGTSGGGGTPDTNPFYLGARNGDGTADLFSNSRIYGIVMLGRILTMTETSDTEQYLADKSGVTL
ncbi:MAG: hypothetical protein ABJG14_11000 [Sulfitobacter sp.]|uniref:hypothetical protein n=1 Tax=Alphaproteobacteria TaxID=28211 RepID=UPI0032653A54